MVRFICITMQQQTVDEKKIILIRNIRQYPDIYENEFARKPFLHRARKQQLWDSIAKQSGFTKTEEAICKWRSLRLYLRNHLQNVANKKLRRYIPLNHNPNDKYLQLNDWPYYREMEFLVPYIKAQINSVQKIHNRQTSFNPAYTFVRDESPLPAITVKTSKTIAEETEEESSLREFFNLMLKSMFKLSQFHQQRVKEKILNVLKQQKLKI
uniref:MADF domain-containing protein n=1 Tax=Glossina brevipalpis TaxID=37001 RepID=A0A1A9WC89_9MUSC